MTNWINARVAMLPDEPLLSDAVMAMDQDELHTFTGDKNEAYILTIR